jgi:hypothetical protein
MSEVVGLASKTTRQFIFQDRWKLSDQSYRPNDNGSGKSDKTPRCGGSPAVHRSLRLDEFVASSIARRQCVLRITHLPMFEATSASSEHAMPIILLPLPLLHSGQGYRSSRPGILTLQALQDADSSLLIRSICDPGCTDGDNVASTEPGLDVVPAGADAEQHGKMS